MSYLVDHSLLVNMAFNTFSAVLKSKPFLNMTVHEYLWAYDDPIIKYGHNIMPDIIPFATLGYMDRVRCDSFRGNCISNNCVFTFI